MEEEKKPLVKDLSEGKALNEEEVPQKPKNVFKYKNYTLTFLGALVSNLGSILYSFAVSFYILALTGNNAFIQGAYLATGGIVYVAVTLFGGVISDRFHKGKIMYICDYLKGIVIIGFTLLLMLVFQDNTAKVVILFIIAIISNVIAAIFSPAASSLLPLIVPEESIQQGTSYSSMMQSSLGILGVILAGILYSVLPINVLFLIVGGCYLLSGLSEMFIRYNHQKKEERLTMKTVFSDIGEGFKYVFNLKPILYLMGAILFVNFFFSPISSNFLPYFIVTDVASNDYLFKSWMEPEMWQSILSVTIALGMIIMALIYSMRKSKESISKELRISFIAFLTICIVMTVFYVLFAQNVIGINALLISLIFITFLIGCILVTINIPSSTKMMKIVDKEKLGKVSSVLDIGSQGLIPLSTFLAGLVIETLGAMWLLVIATGGIVLTTTFILINKQISKL